MGLGDMERVLILFVPPRLQMVERGGHSEIPISLNYGIYLEL